MSNKIIKIGLVGLGFISDVHIETFQQRKDVQIAALSDTNQSLLLKKSQSLAITNTYPDYSYMLRDETLDVIDVMTPHYLHKPYIISALRAGKTVISEKPVTTSSNDLSILEKEAKKSQKKIYIKQYLRHSLAYQKAKELIAKGEIGSIYFVQCLFTGNSIQYHKDPRSWRGNIKEAGGGVFMDIGVHILDLLQSFFGPPLSVYSTMNRIESPLPQKGEDFANSVFEYPNNLTIGIGCSQCDLGYGFRWELRFYGTKGVMTIIDISRDLKELNVIKNNTVIFNYKENNWWHDSNIRAINGIVNNIIQNKEPQITLKEAKSVIKAVESAYKSHESKSRISIK